MGSSKKKSPKAKTAEKKNNPFDLKFNKIKHDVLGKRKGSVGVGNPSLSKKRANEQRQRTLGVEHERIGKVNKVIDKRIGERDNAKTAEEKASLRFMAERTKNFNKSKGSKFNLGDDIGNVDKEDSLTHGGKSLTAIQKYDRTAASDDDDDDDAPGAIGANIVKMAHFGGGNFDKPGSEGSRKDLIADMIARTKQARQQKYEARDEQETLTNDLDEKYSHLLGKVKAIFRPPGAKKEAVETDDYDKLALSLKLESDTRATPAERTKTEAERAADDKDRLVELESLRLARMNTKNNKKVHVSADAEIEQTAVKVKPTPFVVRFNESGGLLDKEQVERVSIKKIAVDSDDEPLSDQSDEDDEEDLDDMLKDSDNEEEEAEVGSDLDDEDGDSEDDIDDEEDDEEDGDEDTNSTGCDTVETNIADKDMLAKTVTKDDVDRDIPFVFEMPRKYSALIKMLSQYDSSKLGIIIERLIKCHHPSLKNGNKQLLGKLFLLLLRLFDETSKVTPSQETALTLGTLIRALYIIMKFDVEYSVRSVRALIRQNWKLRIEKARRAAPSFAVVALMRLVAALFPVSDVWHPVCTPTMALAAVTMADCQITSLTVLSRQVLIATTLGDFVEESKRYVPEVIAFLHGALLLAVDNKEGERAPSVAFPVSMPHRQMLCVSECIDSGVRLEPLKLSEVFNASHEVLEDSQLNRARVLSSVIAIIQKFRLIYSTHVNSFTAIFRPFVILLERIDCTKLPSELSDRIESLLRSMDSECKRLARVTQLSQVKTEKSMLKMLEPVIEENFDPDRPRNNRDPNRKGPAAETSKMKYLYKQEMRGAMKEIRKDTTFLRRKELKEMMAKDKARKEKTKRIMSGLQDQQGEWNKEIFLKDREKKKRKRQY